MTFDDDRSLERQTQPLVIQRLAAAFDISVDAIGEAPEDDDLHYATDLITNTGLRIASRVRRPEYYNQKLYRNEFTIRTERDRGSTELEKILHGWGDFNFYGHLRRAQPPAFRAFIIGDLTEFRLWYRHQTNRPGDTFCNPDGSSNFAAFNILQLPRHFIHTWKDPRFVDTTAEAAAYRAAVEQWRSTFNSDSFLRPSSLKSHTAYRFGLCVDCRIHPYSAGRPRCERCHYTYSTMGVHACLS